jgi:hypothetical protein
VDDGYGVHTLHDAEMSRAGAPIKVARSRSLPSSRHWVAHGCATDEDSEPGWQSWAETALTYPRVAEDHQDDHRFDYVRCAASRISPVISSGWEISDRWLAFTSIVLAPMRLAMKRSRSGLIVRSSVDTA